MEGCPLSTYIAKTVKVSGYALVYGDAYLEGDVNISSGWIRAVHWWRDVP